MIEKMFDLLPDWVQHKLVIRMVYTAASFLAAHAAAFLVGPVVQHGWGVVVLFGAHAGIPFAPNLLTGPVDTMKLEVYVSGILMIGAEWLIQHFHDNHVKPIVAPETQGGTPS